MTIVNSAEFFLKNRV